MADATYTVVHARCKTVTTGVSEKMGDPVWCRQCNAYYEAREFNPWTGPYDPPAPPRTEKSKSKSKSEPESEPKSEPKSVMDV